MADLDAELRRADTLAVRDDARELILGGVRINPGAAVRDPPDALDARRLHHDERCARIRQHAEMRDVPWARHAVVRRVLAHRRHDNAVGEIELIDFVWRKECAGHEALGKWGGGAAGRFARDVASHRDQVNRATASASVCARGTSESTMRNSSGVCALPPIGPTAQMVGVPTPEVKPESAQPPVNSPSTWMERSFAQAA